MLVWAVRMMVLWGGVGVACFYAWSNRADLMPLAAPGATHQAAAKPAQVPNTLSFKTDRTAHSAPPHPHAAHPDQHGCSVARRA